MPQIANIRKAGAARLKVSFIRCCGLLLAALLAGVAPARAAEKPAPYTPVKVRIPNDAAVAPGFDAFLKTLKAAVARKDRAALQALVGPKFFFTRDFGGVFDPKATALVNFERALTFDQEATAWKALEQHLQGPFARDDTPVKTAVCGPARPRYDPMALAALARKTGTEGFPDWDAVPAGTAVLDQPKADAKSIETVGLIMIRRLETEAEAVERGFVKVATPRGKVGYIRESRFASLGEPRLCLAADTTGHWRIVGFIGGGD